MLGLAYDDLLQGRSYQARSVHFASPSFDAMINRDKPPAPLVKSPLMVDEALASIRQPLRVDSLSITNGHFRYCERLVIEPNPPCNVRGGEYVCRGPRKPGEPRAAINSGAGRSHGRRDNEGVMTIPVTSSDFSFHYSGSLSAMDLTRLNAFLEIAEHTRITSGSAQEADFETT